MHALSWNVAKCLVPSHRPLAVSHILRARRKAFERCAQTWQPQAPGRHRRLLSFFHAADMRTRYALHGRALLSDRSVIVSLGTAPHRAASLVWLFSAVRGEGACCPWSERIRFFCASPRVQPPRQRRGRHQSCARNRCGNCRSHSCRPPLAGLTGARLSFARLGPSPVGPSW